MKRKRVFISYAHEDVAFRDALTVHLEGLCSAGIIDKWHDGEIGPGQDWKRTIDRELQVADIIVLIVSASFLASKSCQQLELEPALRRWNDNDVLIVPVIVRACDWEVSPIAKLQVLPQHGRPVAMWAHPDEAWTQVTRTIRTAATRDHVDLSTPRAKQSTMTAAAPTDNNENRDSVPDLAAPITTASLILLPEEAPPATQHHEAIDGGTPVATVGGQTAPYKPPAMPPSANRKRRQLFIPATVGGVVAIGLTIGLTVREWRTRVGSVDNSSETENQSSDSRPVVAIPTGSHPAASGQRTSDSGTPSVSAAPPDPSTTRALTVSTATVSSENMRYEATDEIVVDKKTGSVWQRKLSTAKYTNHQASVYCHSLKLAGRKWTVPTLVQLQTIADSEKGPPKIDVDAFPDTPPELFWTSSG